MKRQRPQAFLAAVLLAWAPVPAGAAARETLTLGPGVEAQVDEPQDGVIVCRVTSPFQPGTTLVRIVAPDKLEPRGRQRVLFVLPVEPGLGTRWGDGLATVRKLDAANRFGFVVVAPTFAQWPWCADHPTDPAVRQESHVLKAVVPLVERLYPHEPRQRALLGFSKGGWAAWSLLLRHPDQFAAAVAWDAPLMMPTAKFGMAVVLPTQEAFERWRIPTLLAEHADAVRGTRRLALLGTGNFRADHGETHALLERLGIPHDYTDGPPRKHRWDSGWAEEAVQALDRLLPPRESGRGPVPSAK